MVFTDLLHYVGVAHGARGSCIMQVGGVLLRVVRQRSFSLGGCVPLSLDSLHARFCEPSTDTTTLLEERVEDGPVWFYDTKPPVPFGSSISEREGRKWYAVRRGRKVGLFDSWEKCKTLVHGYKGSDYKSFRNINDAFTYLHR